MSLWTLVTGLDRSRFEPFVLLARPGPLQAQLERAGIPTAVVPYQGWRRVLTTWRARSLMRKRHIDLVYLNSVVGFSRAVGRAAKSLGLPAVWHVREAPSSARVERNRRWLRRLATQVLVVSEEQRLALSTPDCAPPIQVDNGVDLGRFDRAVADGLGFRFRHGLPASKPVFGMVGTVEERKNVAAVVDAVGRLCASGGDLYLAVIGRADSEYAAALQGRVAEHALLRGRVFFVGEIDDVPSALAALDCLVMASRWEGFPRGLLEGICMGVPVIATDVGEVAAMLDHHSGGRIIPVDDGEALAAAMTDVLAHPHVAWTLAQETATRARERYSQAAHVTRMSALLEDVAERASSEGNKSCAGRAEPRNGS